MSLKAHASSGVKWSSASLFGRRGISLLTNIAMARLLAPSDFGLVAMSAVITGFIEVFRDMGTATAIIQRKNPSEALLSSVFWLNVLFGCVATISVLLIAPLIGSLFHEAQVVPILRLMSISFALSAVAILQQALLIRRLAFELLAKLEFFSALFASMAGVACALYGFGPWSIALQMLTGTALTTLLLWRYAGWRPSRTFSWTEAKSVMQFSLNLTAFNVFNYFARNADNFLIGRYLGAESLGFYDLAYRLMIYPLQGISAVIGRVMFPLFTHVQDNLARFRNAYLSIAWAIAFVSFPLMLGLMSVAELFVLTLFGEQWRPVIALLLIFAPLGALQSIATTVGSIYQARGRTDWLLRWGLGAGSLIVLSFVIGLNWGVLGVAVAYTTVTVILLYPNFAIPFRLIDLTVRELVDVLWRPMVCSILMATVVTIVSSSMASSEPGWQPLSLLVMVGVVAYLIFTWFLNREQMIALWSTLQGTGGSSPILPLTNSHEEV
jgi:O-antigen/teichoic acid export membrane protein